MSLAIFVINYFLLSLNPVSDHQYLAKVSIDIFLFLHGDCHQWNVASEIATFTWPGVPVI